MDLKIKRPRILGPSLLVLAGAVSPPVSWAAGEMSSRRQVRIPLTGQERVTTQDLGLEDLTVLLGQEAQSIQQIDRSPVGSTRLGDERAWQVVVYFDAPLSTRDGLRQAADLLSRESETLTNLGPTEIVLADPRPRQLLTGSRNPLTVKEALGDLRSEALTTGELIWHRQRFSSTDAELNRSEAARALEREVELIRNQRTELLRWLTRPTSTGPRLLILVQNGYDLNPRTFYTGQSAGSFLENPFGGITQAAAAKQVAVNGWTVLCLALGPRPEEFSDPTAPLFELARTTGGDVITSRRRGTRLLESVAMWPVLVVNLAADEQAGPQSLGVHHSHSKQQLQATRWASAATPSAGEEFELPLDPGYSDRRPVLKLLRPEGLALEGVVRFRTITARHRIARVEFLLDDLVVTETERTPFTALIDLGQGIRPHKLSAVAYSRSDRRLGEDSLQLNTALEPPRVTITNLDYSPEVGTLDIAATATAPSGNRPDRVEVFYNNRKKASLTESPYRIQITLDELRPSDFVRVVAVYPTGDTAEAARLPFLSEPGDELDVNLVQLLAMVTPRNRRMSLQLDRTDFVVRQKGKPLPIDHFSQWEELDLTLGLVLDTSDSMDVILEDARSAGERLFQAALSGNSKAFVVDFNDVPRLASQATADSARLLHSLEGLEARGDTALYDAIVFSLQQFKSSSGRRALVVVTDGKDSASYYQPQECVRQAKLHGVPVYLIVLGSPPDPHRNPERMRNLMVARRSGGDVYYISDLDDLTRIYDQIVKELRRQYFLAFNTGHMLTPQELEEIEIEMIPKGVSVRTLLASQQSGG